MLSFKFNYKGFKQTQYVCQQFFYFCLEENQFIQDIKDSSSSNQIEAERTSQSLKTMTNENNLPSTSKQLDAKPNKELEIKAVKSISPS